MQADGGGVAVVAWGGFLAPIEKALQQFHWRNDGPALPLEFTHFSLSSVPPKAASSSVDGEKEQRKVSLSLVIDEKNGAPSTAFWMKMPGITSISEALRKLEEIFDDIHRREPSAFCSLRRSGDKHATKGTNFGSDAIAAWIAEIGEVKSAVWVSPAPNLNPDTAMRLIEDETMMSPSLVFEECLGEILASPGMLNSAVQAHAHELYLKRKKAHCFCVSKEGLSCNYCSCCNFVDSGELSGVLKSWLGDHTYLGRSCYVEYIEGNIPLVLSAPHGGWERPTEIPDRKTGVLDGDYHTKELTCEVGMSIVSSNSSLKVPHMIICHLDRIKLDANRNLIDGANGDRYASIAWWEFNTFIEIAKRTVVATYGEGHYLDMHGNNSSSRVMVGNLIRRMDFEKEKEPHAARLFLCEKLAVSSLRTLAERKSREDAKMQLLLGDQSLAYLMEREGIASTPVGEYPFDWGGPDYYNGGPNTVRHGSCKYGGAVNGTQIETPLEMRRQIPSIQNWAKMFIRAVHAFMLIHYSYSLLETINK